MYNRTLKERDREIKRQRKIDESIQENIKAIDKRINDRNVVMPIIENIIMRKEHEEKIAKKNDIKEKLVGTLQYKYWVICWDLLNDNYFQIESDIQNGKTTMAEVNEIKQKINSIHDIISYEF